MSKPFIGVSGSHIREASIAYADLYRSYVNHDYLRSVEEAGGIPIIVPFTENDAVAREVVKKLDGLVLSGGHDVYPLYYGEEPLQGLGDVWPQRDHFDFTLIEAAEEMGIPILAICRGHQIVNVYHGGTLYQDLKYDKNCSLKHSQDQTPSLPTHTITMEADSVLAHILGKTECLVNSHHHQTVNRVGEGLRVTAVAKDGTIEALEGTDYPWLITCQFHPEMMTINNEDAKKIFSEFVRVAATNIK